ncbi:MAG: YtxH domain-containing protein [Nitrospirae bacterium]|nr:MAG: YtxH domain-containing protein [Nitrospirota bacterium]
MRNDECGFSSGSVLLSFLLGGMVGAGLALLLAPQSGTETRRRIRELADDLKERGEHYIDDAKVKVHESVEKSKGFYEKEKSAINAALEAGKEAYSKEVHK